MGQITSRNTGWSLKCTLVGEPVLLNKLPAEGKDEGLKKNLYDIIEGFFTSREKKLQDKCE